MLFRSFGEFPKFRKIPWGVNGEPLTGNIGDRNDFIFRDIMKIGWAGVIAGPEHRSFASIFFWRIFKMTKILAIFCFFYCMISLPNRRFLAYMQKKFPLEKSSSGTSIRLLHSKLSKYCIVLYCIYKYCIRSATETVCPPVESSM